MKKKTYIAPEATIHTVTLQPLLTPSLTESGNQLRIDMSGTQRRQPIMSNYGNSFPFQPQVEIIFISHCWK